MQRHSGRQLRYLDRINYCSDKQFMILEDWGRGAHNTGHLRMLFGIVEWVQLCQR